MSNIILLPTAKGATTPPDNLVRRLTEHAQRNEKMRASLENLNSVEGWIYRERRRRTCRHDFERPTGNVDYHDCCRRQIYQLDSG